MEVIFSIIVNEDNKDFILEGVKRFPERLVYTVYPRKKDNYKNSIYEIEAPILRIQGTQQQIKQQLDYVVNALYEHSKEKNLP